MKRRSSVLILIVFVCFIQACGEIQSKSVESRNNPETVFLTWQRDPTTTMTVDWHMEGGGHDHTIRYREKGEEVWLSDESTTFGFPFTSRVVHRVELVNLKPGSEYEFKPGESDIIYSFRTMPATLTRPIRFIEGGDVVGEGFEKMTKTASEYDPDFIALGGDLSYSQGEPKNYPNWYRFFDVFKNGFSGENNRIVPVIMAIGNHEIWTEVSIPDELPLDYYRNKYNLQVGDAPYYNALNAFPGQPEYGVLDFGNYLSWLILDTGHRNSITGNQLEWLEENLAERADRPHLLTSYHVPAYPSHRSFDGGTSTQVREHWVPLFEKYGVDFAFEHHDHTYKRTYPMWQNKVAEEGIVFMGDGAWGVDSRELEVMPPRWYLKKAVAQRHVIVGFLDESGIRFEIVNEDGNLIDAYPEDEDIAQRIIDTDTRVVTKKFPDPVKVNEQDSLVLVKLYHMAGGENWITKNNWLKGPVQSWFGITLRGDRVSRIYLSDNNLVGELPAEIAQLEGIERIYIQNNPGLGGEIPRGMDKLKELYRIRMSGNNFEGEIPSEIGSMSWLRILLLGNNNLSGEIPPELSKLKLVTNMDLSGNKFTGNIPPELGRLNFRLQQLDLSNNELEGEIPEELGDMKFLKKLDISGNNFNNNKDIPAKILELKEKDLVDFKY